MFFSHITDLPGRTQTELSKGGRKSEKAVELGRILATTHASHREHVSPGYASCKSVRKIG